MFLIKKKNMLKTADYLLKQHCCDQNSCNQLVDDLQDIQFKCNDAFKNDGRNSLDSDEKGNIEGTVCYQLRDKKNRILSKFKNSKLGGNKNLKKKLESSQKREKIKEASKIEKLVKIKQILEKLDKIIFYSLISKTSINGLIARSYIIRKCIGRLGCCKV
jgi:hypothetical protein